MAAFVYEGVLLFGVVMLVGVVFGVAAQQRHALAHRQGLQATLFLALSLYFMWFWFKGGQTLAMKTWHLRLVQRQGLPITLRQAALRFVVSWLWLWPPLALSWLAQWHQTRQVLGLVLVWVMLYAFLSKLLPQRQFLHDLICQTRLIDTQT